MWQCYIISELRTVWQISNPIPKELEARDFSRWSVHEYIRNACYARATTFTDDDLESGYVNAKAQLMKIKGIGNKVADCILLFGLHYLDAFPVDTHIRKIIDREYDGELPEWANSKYAGLLQQYLFYYSLNHKPLQIRTSIGVLRKEK